MRLATLGTSVPQIVILAMGFVLTGIAMFLVAGLFTPSAAIAEAGSRDRAAQLVDGSVPTSSLDPCTVQSIVPYASPGPFLPRDGTTLNGQLLTSLPDPVSGINQIYLQSGTANNCLTCSPPSGSGAPALDRYKKYPIWATTSQGPWIVFIAEAPDGPTITTSSDAGSQLQEVNGYFADVWVMDPTAQHFYQLTSYPQNPKSPNNPRPTHGVLPPRASPDGNWLAWSAIYRWPDTPPTPTSLRASLISPDVSFNGAFHPSGYWKFYVANFAVTGGVPTLQNIADETQPSGTLYETQDWSPDSTQVQLDADIGMKSQYGWDANVFDRTTGQFTDVSNTPGQWEEHQLYSPDGKTIAFMSSAAFPTLVAQFGLLALRDYMAELRTEIFLMNPDGSHWRRITFFNSPPPNPSIHQEYSPGGPSVGVVPKWSYDGTQLLVTQKFANGSNLFWVKGYWLVTFVGSCGGSAGTATATPTEVSLPTSTATMVP